ncbi:uncharacterized protein LOC144107559 [Amblyomma americanum]
MRQAVGAARPCVQAAVARPRARHHSSDVFFLQPEPVPCVRRGGTGDERPAAGRGALSICYTGAASCGAGPSESAAAEYAGGGGAPAASGDPAHQRPPRMLRTSRFTHASWSTKARQQHKSAASRRQ